MNRRVPHASPDPRVAADRAPGSAPGRTGGLSGLAIAAAFLAVYALTQSAAVFGQSFLNDDYVFIELARNATFPQLFDPDRLPFHWYRPLSSSVYFWALQRVFGMRELPQFLTQLALMAAVWVLYFATVRRLAGARTAAVAVAGLVAMCAWTPTVMWISGGQDLWMLFWVLLAVFAGMGRAAWLLTPLTLAALLSKETAIVLPAILTLQAFLVRGLRGRALLARIAGPWLVTAGWVFLHPWLFLRLHPEQLGITSAGGSTATRALRTVLAPWNLHLAPDPAGGWGAALAIGGLGAVLLAGLVLVFRRAGAGAAARAPSGRPGARPAPSPRADAGALAFATGWAVLGWLPLLAPTDAWNAYYALLGSLGAWLAVALAVAPRLAIAVPLIALVAVLRPAVAATPVYEWGHEAWQRYSSEQMIRLRADLLRDHPTVPKGSRFFFANSPQAMNIIGVHDHPFRVWYADSTIRARFMSDWRPREHGAGGRDFFYNFFADRGWVETVTGPEDVKAARAAHPDWAEDHDRLGGTLYERGAPEAALVEFEKLATEFPDVAGYAYKAAACALAAGRHDAAGRWLDEAERRPVTRDALRGMIEATRRELREARRGAPAGSGR